MRAVLLILALIHAPWPGLPAQARPEQFEVAGSVVDEAGRPVSGVIVGVFWQVVKLGGILPVHRALTDAEGRFTLRLHSETYWDAALVLAHDAQGGRAGMARHRHSQSPGPEVIRLGPAGKVRGAIECPAIGEAPQRFQLSVFQKGDRHAIVAWPFGSGAFEIPLPLGAYILGFRSSDFKQCTWNFELSASAPELELRRLEVEPTLLARHFGKAPPDWKVTHAQGIAPETKPADFHGRWVLLAFWRHEAGKDELLCLATLIGLSRSFQDLGDGFALLAFHVGKADDLESLHNILGQTDLALPVGGPAVHSRDLPFALLHDATPHTRSVYEVFEKHRYVILDPTGAVVRGADPELFHAILQGARKERARGDGLLARLKAEKNPRKAALLVAEIAVEGGEGAARALIAYGGEVKDRACHLALLEGLGRLGWPGARPFLCGERGLKAREAALRQAAIGALGALGEAAAVPDLLELLHEKTVDPSLIGTALAVLVKLAPADPRVRAAVEELAASRNPAQRGQGLEGLAALAGADLPARLAGALTSDENAAVRLKAVQLLARIKPPEAIALLRKAAQQDRSPAVRKAAEAALKALESGG